MSDFKDFTPEELQGHRIGITCPGPSYAVLVHDLNSGLAISNVSSFVLTWDRQTRMIATLTLEGHALVDVEVHHLHTTADLDSVQEEPQETTSSIAVPVFSPVSEAPSEPLSSSDGATGIHTEQQGGDTEPEVPAVTPEPIAVEEVQPEQEVQ